MNNMPTKILILLVVALVPVQPMMAFSCHCTNAQSVARDKTPGEGKGSCCQSSHSCCATDITTPPSCCSATRPSDRESNCRCQAICSCQSKNTPPTEQQVPTESRSRVVELTIQTVAAVSFLNHDKLQEYPCDLSTNSLITPTGVECCITFCRFLL